MNLFDIPKLEQDLKTLENADILVINGAGMESFLEDIISQYPNIKIIDASKGLNLLEDDTHDHDHDNEHAHDHDHENEHDHDHDHDHEYNAHVWVSVSGNIDQVKNIASQLETLNPENKDLYEANTNTYISKLENLKDVMHSE